jgi:Ran GTPase-activating protein (RanGAP) involved in mRNA processing and transport
MHVEGTYYKVKPRDRGKVEQPHCTAEVEEKRKEEEEEEEEEEAQSISRQQRACTWRPQQHCKVKE